MKKILLPILLMASMTLVACNDWLDVNGENSQKEEQQFSELRGFKSALTGCYMALADESIYGEAMTMTSIEMLANVWHFEGNESYYPLQYQLYNHQYSGDYALNEIQSIYASLFNVVAQANMIIKNADNFSGDINKRYLDAIKGEAYAIRAYCQFDILRLFGQVPQGEKQVELPYSFTTGIDEMPGYYGWDSYITLLKSDFAMADSLLKANDPILEFTYAQLNSPSGAHIDDDYFYYRQSRLNYWAVQALQARFYLYIGDTVNANKYAMSLIEATYTDGTPVITLSGLSDLNAGYNGCPTECLFYLSKYDVNTTANAKLVGGRAVQVRDNHYTLTLDKLNQLYATVSPYTGSHNRFNMLWNRNLKNPYSEICPATMKYYYDDTKAKNVMTKHQIVPMLRMSEIYLIAIETATDLAKANELYKEYMTQCACSVTTDFATHDELKAEVINEYRRELIAEGQMFFTYKRINASEMLWCNDEISEDTYIIPLPRTEYNPKYSNQ